MIVLFLYEWKIKPDGLFHHGLFRKRSHNFAISLLLMMVKGCSLFGAHCFFLKELAVLFEIDPVRIGPRFAVVFLVALVSTMTAAIESSWPKTLKWPFA